MRYRAIGHTHALRVLVVIWTLRGEAIRPVTAWPAPSSIAKDYFENR